MVEIICMARRHMAKSVNVVNEAKTIRWSHPSATKGQILSDCYFVTTQQIMFCMHLYTHMFMHSFCPGAADLSNGQRVWQEDIEKTQADASNDANVAKLRPFLNEVRREKRNVHQHLERPPSSQPRAHPGGVLATRARFRSVGKFRWVHQPVQYAVTSARNLSDAT